MDYDQNQTRIERLRNDELARSVLMAAFAMSLIRLNDHSQPPNVHHAWNALKEAIIEPLSITMGDSRQSLAFRETDPQPHVAQTLFAVPSVNVAKQCFFWFV